MKKFVLQQPCCFWMFCFSVFPASEKSIRKMGMSTVYMERKL